MNIIVYYPQSEEVLHDLQKKVADVHAEAVLQYLQKLSCPQAQKQKLIDELSKSCQKK